MKITKYLHSCLLLEEAGQQLLFDPGTFSFAEKQVEPEVFRNVSAVVITHNHADHLDVGALQQIVQLSDAMIYSTQEVADKLTPERLHVQVLTPGELTLGNFHLHIVDVTHEPLLADSLPTVLAFLINGKLLNPADSLSPNLLQFQGVEMLALPIMAPFLTEVQAFEFARNLGPKQVLPIHDGFVKPFYLKSRHENYARHFRQLHIDYRPLVEPGESLFL